MKVPNSKIVRGETIGKCKGWYVYLYCNWCSKKRWTLKYLIKKPTFTGLCHSCNLKRMSGNKHPSWKGGKYINQEGYVMVLAHNHPLAKKEGYILEHRLVASEKWGIFAVMDMIVHHKDGDRGNNNIENLELLTPSIHSSKHKNPFGLDSRLRGESNPTIKCACGCGQIRLKYDKCGRPRKYIQNHSRENQHTTSNY